jgi:hypothetical protein
MFSIQLQILYEKKKSMIIQKLFELCNTNTRGRIFKLQKEQCKKEVRKHVFQTENNEHLEPSSVVSATTAN